MTTEPQADYTSVEVIFNEPARDGGIWWRFDHTTAKPDITAYELALILRLAITVQGDIIGGLKAECPEAMRHFACSISRHTP